LLVSEKWLSLAGVAEASSTELFLEPSSAELFPSGIDFLISPAFHTIDMIAVLGSPFGTTEWFLFHERWT
jgi:hypothetical protein